MGYVRLKQACPNVGLSIWSLNPELNYLKKNNFRHIQTKYQRTEVNRDVIVADTIIHPPLNKAHDCSSLSQLILCVKK